MVHGHVTQPQHRYTKMSETTKEDTLAFLNILEWE